MSCCNTAWLSDSCYSSWMASVAKAAAGERIQGILGVIWGSNGACLAFSRSSAYRVPQAAPYRCIPRPLEYCKVWLVQLHRCIALHCVRKCSKTLPISQLAFTYSSQLATSPVITLPCNTALHTLQQHTIPTFPSYFLMKLEWFKGPSVSGQK